MPSSDEQSEPPMKRHRNCFQSYFFFFNDTATTEIYTLSLHDALPIWQRRRRRGAHRKHAGGQRPRELRSEEHTSELQSLTNIVCRLLLEKKTVSFLILEDKKPIKPFYRKSLTQPCH